VFGPNASYFAAFAVFSAAGCYMRLHVGRPDEGDPANDLARGRPQCHHGDALHDARLRPRPPAQLALELEPELAVMLCF
jgi:hypothetical protein